MRNSELFFEKSLTFFENYGVSRGERLRQCGHFTNNGGDNFCDSVYTSYVNERSLTFLLFFIFSTNSVPLLKFYN